MSTKRWLGLVLLAACAEGARRPDPPAAAAPPIVAEPPAHEELSGLARSVLKKRMGRHAMDLENLLAAAVALDYAQTAQIADAVSAEPRIARPDARDLDAANALFPERFFVLQDRLKLEADALATAARARDPDESAAAFGRLASTCLACHALFGSAPQ